MQPQNSVTDLDDGFDTNSMSTVDETNNSSTNSIITEINNGSIESVNDDLFETQTVNGQNDDSNQELEREVI